MVRITNKARSVRGLVLRNGRSHSLPPGETADLDLAPHPVHDAWVASGEVEVAEPELAGPPELYGPPPAPMLALPAPPPVAAVVTPPPIQEPSNERKRGGGRVQRR